MNDIQTILKAVSGERIRRHIRNLEGVRHPLVAPAALERAADGLRAELENLGYPVTEQRFADAGQDYRNIIATRRGTRLPEQRLLLVAHYDTVAASPGADDNASGVAVMLELAKLFQRLLL